MNYTAILTSLMVIGVVGSAMGAGTMAYFSDTETSTGNTMAAGSLDLSLNGYNGVTAGPVVTLNDLKPSQVHYSDPITLTVYNNPGKLYKHIKNVACGTGVVTEPECTEQDGIWTPATGTGANTVPAQCSLDENEDQNNIDEFTWFDMQKQNGVDANGKPIWVDIITERPEFGVDDFTSCWIPLGPYGTPGQTNSVTIRQSFHLDGDVTNWAQGDSCSFDEEFMVVQTNDPTEYPVSSDGRVWDPENKQCIQHNTHTQ